ncbi:MAG: radical SAM protein [Gemmatimonadales bacterium]
MLYRIENGKIQTNAVEYSAAYHCNLRCSSCSHMSPFISKQFPSLESFVKDLTALNRVMHAKDIRLLGGEPLLNPEIVELLKAARASGIADTVMLTTNGLLLHSMKDDFWEHVDFIWLSMYPGRSPTAKALEHIKARAKESNTRLDLDPTSHFRSTYVTEPHEHGWTTDMLFKTCGSAHRFHCHMLYEGRLFKCAVPPFLPEFLAKLGKNGYDPAVDAFDIHGAQELFEGLRAFLFTPKTLEACRYCLGYVGKWENHHQLPPDQLADPVKYPVKRSTHLDQRKFLQETAKYYYRRGVEKVTGRPQW